jgi:hypothetical protein
VCHSVSLLMVLTAPSLIAPFIARRIHAVHATVGGLDGFESSSLRASAAVFQPSVLRPACPSQLALTRTPLAVRLRGLTYLAPAPGPVAGDAVTSDRHGSGYRFDPAAARLHAAAMRWLHSDY